MQPAETASRRPSQRLPVNPRRHRVAPEQRKRVSTACNNCNVRRIKCSGERPCRQCSTSSRDCQYPAPVEKVSISRSELDELKRKCDALEKCLQEAVPDIASRHELLQQVEPFAPSAESSVHSRRDATSEDDSETTEGRLLHDPDGNARYLGETSGATFLDYLKEFMTTVFPLAFNEPWPSNSNNGSTFLASLGRYQTFDSRPLFEPEVDPLWLPTRTEMTVMLAELRYFIQDGNGDFPSGGIYWWGDLSSVPIDPMISSPEVPDLDKYRHLAFYHTAFAVACQATASGVSNSDSDPHMGEGYFARARMLLGNPLDITRYTISDVAVLALMGFYLIEMNRRDAAYMYVSVAMHISIMHGAHRGWVDERGKRVFWTLYILDRWLSCLMGRPPTILDDAVRLPLPCDAPSLPPAAGLRAHVELSRISGHIVCNTYRVAPWEHNPVGAVRHVDKAMQILEVWLNSLPPALQMPFEHLSTDPACCALHMAYNQLLLLAVRPIFFVAVKKAFAEQYITRRWNIEHSEQLAHIRACSDAARRNLHLAKWVMGLNQSRKLLQAGLHYVFNAAIILMLQELVCSNLASTDAGDVIFAIDVFEEESKTGSNYARDCAKVLQDLRSLVQRLRGQTLDQQVGSAQQLPAADDLSLKLPTHGIAVLPPPEQANAPGQSLHYQMNEGDALYQELVTWMDNDDLQLYSNYLI